MVSGQLRLRGADPFALEAPTTITGANDGGQLSGVTLSTPAVTSVRDVPQYGTTATITAGFSMIEPGVGSIGEEGNMTVQLKLAVNLHIVVPLIEGASDCPAAPIDVTLTSTDPYDPDTQRVTLRAATFSVPAVVSTPTCNGLLVDPVNEALAGAGHTLTLTMAGALTPPPKGEPTAASLAVSPEGSAPFGADVALTATVVPAPAVEGAPPVSGVVTFLDDGDPIGTAAVGEDGTATLVTSELRAGLRRLTAAYGGAPPDWDPSASAVVPYSVIAPPGLSTTAAGEVRIGGPAQDFDVTVVNTGFGTGLDDARLEVKINRQSGSATLMNGATPRVALARVVEGTPTDVPLAHMPSPVPASLHGTIGDTSTWALPPGAEHTEHLRLSVAAGTVVGPLSVTFTLVTGDGPDREVLGATSGIVTMVNEARTTVAIDAGGLGFPPGCTQNCVIPAIPPITPTVRQGNVAELWALRITGTVSGVHATGTYSVTIDGVPVKIQHVNSALPDPARWLDAAGVIPSPGGPYLIQVPPTTTVGTHQVTVRYSGDALYAPVQRTWPITVEGAIGSFYDCRGAGILNDSTQFSANVEVQASLPTVWPAGQDLPVDRVQVKMRLSRTTTHQETLTAVIGAGPDDRTWSIGLGPDGEITPTSITRSNHTGPKVGDTSGPDHVVDLASGTGTLAIDPTPGTTSTYTLDRITLTAITTIGFTGGFTCTPTNAPYVVGTVTSAGTLLEVEPGGPVASGADVNLTAKVFPVAPGFVEFRDGASTIGVVPVDAEGVAAMSTDDLPEGTRSLTARFFGGAVASTPSAAVELRVAACGAASEPGSGAVVRLVYLELLGRCPDAAGYSYWKGRLDGGTSREAFARSIAGTAEAVGRVVDDAYQAMLSRPADPAGRAFWTRRLQASGRYDQLLADLAASSEFWSKAGSSNGGAVTRIYERLLDRTPDQGGLDFWVGRLDGGVSRRALVLALADLAEPLGVLVDDTYDEILDRKPTAAERTAGIARLRSTGDRSGLYAQLIGTQEFHERAQGLPDPV